MILWRCRMKQISDIWSTAASTSSVKSAVKTKLLPASRLCINTLDWGSQSCCELLVCRNRLEIWSSTQVPLVVVSRVVMCAPLLWALPAISSPVRHFRCTSNGRRDSSASVSQQNSINSLWKCQCQRMGLSHPSRYSYPVTHPFLQLGSSPELPKRRC